MIGISWFLVANQVNPTQSYVTEWCSPSFFSCVRSLDYAYHCVWAPLRPSDSDIGQNWKTGTGRLFSKDPKRCFWCLNHRQSTHHPAFHESVELHWWTQCGDKVIWYDRDSIPRSFDTGPSVLTTWPRTDSGVMDNLSAHPSSRNIILVPCISNVIWTLSELSMRCQAL
jgi:hypothetical protein